MKKQPMERPSISELETELKRVKYKNRYSTVLKSTVFSLITVAAAAVLVATLWLPVLQIFGSSMTPTLQDGDIVFSVKSSKLEQGDVVAFYYNNKILIKRVIAGPGEFVTMDEEGNVYVNSVLLDEPYLTERSYGQTNIELPYQVPDEQYFVMGDHRSTSVDSRNTAVGCITEDQIVGKIVFRIWPMKEMGPVG